MTGKEALDDYKDFGKIKGQSITSNHTFVPSDYHYEWKKEKNIEDELAKYYMAFVILKDTVDFNVFCREVKQGDRVEKTYFIIFGEIWVKITKGEDELLEELMK